MDTRLSKRTEDVVRDRQRSKAELLQELNALRRRVAELKEAEEITCLK
jgi:hypothetical protein